MNRRSFLRGLLATTAAPALPPLVPETVRFTTYTVSGLDMFGQPMVETISIGRMRDILMPAMKLSRYEVLPIEWDEFFDGATCTTFDNPKVSA